MAFGEWQADRRLVSVHDRASGVPGDEPLISPVPLAAMGDSGPRLELEQGVLPAGDRVECTPLATSLD